MCILVYMTDVLSLRVPSETKARLDRLSHATNRPASVYVREALEAHLDKLEYEYMILQRVSEVRSGKAETVSLEEMDRRLGLAD